MRTSHSSQSKSNRGFARVRGNRAALAGAAALAVASFAPITAHATELFWDTNNSAAGAGGSGTWDLAATNWAPAAGGLTATGVWVDGDDANLQAPITPIGALGTVTVSGTRSVGMLTFGATALAQNYLVTGGTISVGNTTQGIVMNTNTSNTNTGEVILSNITGAGDLVVSRNISSNGTLLNLGGGGTTGTTVGSWGGNLVIAGSGTGNTFSTSNKVSIGNATALPQGAGNGIIFKQNGAQLLFTGGTGVGNANAAYQASFNNDVNLNGSGQNITFNSDIGATANGTVITFTGLIHGQSDLTFGVGLSGGQGKIVLNHPGGMNWTGATNILLTATGSTSGIVAIGSNDQLPVGTTLTFAGTTGIDGAFDMAGFNQRVAGLASQSTGTMTGVVNSTGTLSTLTVDGAVTGAYNGSIGIPPTTTGVAGATDNLRLVLASTNSGSLTLSRPAGSTYNGGTQIDGGALLVTNTSGSATGTGAVGIGAGGKLGGTGSVSGLITSSGKIAPGASSTSTGTFTAAGGLTLNANSTNDLKFAVGANDKVAVTGGTLTLPGSGTSKIDLIDLGNNIANTPVTNYTLFSYAALSGDPVTNMSVVAPTTGAARNATFTLVNNTTAKTIELNVINAGSLITWRGDGTGNGAWDVNTTTNWTDGTNPVVFHTNDVTTFDDTANGSSTVTVTVDPGGVSPSNVIVNNNRLYTFTGGSINGNGTSLTKSGTATLNLATSNGYTGGTVVNAGTLEIAGDSSLGAVPTSPAGVNLTLNKPAAGVTLRFDNDTTLAANRTIVMTQSGGSGPTFSTGSNVTIAGQILGGTAGGVNLIKIGTGTLTLLGDNSTNAGGGFVNAMIVNGGTLRAPQDVSLGQLTKGITLNAGGFQFAGSFDAASRPITISSGGGTIDSGGFTGTFSGAIGGTGGTVGLTKTGAGTIVLSATNNTYSGNLTVAGGTLRLASNLTTPSSVTVNSGTLEIATGAGATRVLRSPAISVGAARLDIQDNKIVTQTPAGTWDGAQYTGVSGMVASGKGPGNAWNGNGIVTGQPAAQGSNFTSIGVAQASDVRPATATATATWAGQTITGTDTLVMYTYGGDATLDGKINVDDYIRIDSGIAAHLTGWSNGDFNYDGKVNIDDYTGFIDANIGTQGPAFPTAGGIADAGGGGASGVSAVPEPATFSVLALAGTALLARRRRTRRQ